MISWKVYIVQILEVLYQYTQKRTVDIERLWTVVGNEEAFIVSNNGDKRLLPILCFKEYAQAFCVNDRTNMEMSFYTTNIKLI